MDRIKIAILALFLALIFYFLSGCNPSYDSSSEEAQRSSDELIEILNNADVVTVKNNPISLSKSYSIEVEGEIVATIDGEIVKMLGDTLTMYDIDGNVIAYEEEVKRFGKLNRSAVIKNESDEVLGYIGEKTVTKFTSIGYYFHFYDSNKKELGVSDQVNLSLLKKNNFTDNDGNIDYKIEKQLDFVDSYEITIDDTSDIPLYHAIFMVCIEDAIHSASSQQ